MAGYSTPGFGITTVLTRFIRDETGATSIEYALVGTLVSLAIISGMTGISNQVEGLFSRVQNRFSE